MDFCAVGEADEVVVGVDAEFVVEDGVGGDDEGLDGVARHPDDDCVPCGDRPFGGPHFEGGVVDVVVEVFVRLGGTSV